VLHKINLYPMFAVYIQEYRHAKIKTLYKMKLRMNQITNTNKYIHTCLAKKTQKDYRLKPSKSPVESPSCRHRQKIRPLNKEVCLGSFLFIFLDTDPHLASVVCVPLSLFRFEIRVVCVWELVYVCACEHKFGVATNHGKF
jgi:hypothetical protein